VTENRQLRTKPELALEALIEGNRRYASNQTAHPDRGAERRAALSEKQEPFATIVGCADSRVPAEFVFDCGLGDLFVVRTAGHVVDDAVMATIEFGAQQLGIPLVFVLGHERCGAVKAALDDRDGVLSDAGFARPLVAAIAPAIKHAADKGGDRWDNTVRANIELTIDRLKASSVLSAAMDAGRLRIVGGLYSLESGSVEVTVS
jgi:carbonic anhydrase